jgi:hypothetical protein
MADKTKTYNKALKKIVDLLEEELPGDALVSSIRRSYSLAVMEDKTLLITETGPELYNYREYIANDRWDELINKDWEKEVAEAGVSDSQAIIKMIQTLRKVWTKYGDDEKRRITKYIKLLLSEYCKYIISK